MNSILLFHFYELFKPVMFKSDAFNIISNLRKQKRFIALIKLLLNTYP
jgi:hypothetical protein